MDDERIGSVGASMLDFNIFLTFWGGRWGAPSLLLVFGLWCAPSSLLVFGAAEAACAIR